jgi:hypothetical protein
MELQLQPLASACFVSGRSFAEGDRVTSFLVRGKNQEVVRYDVLTDESGEFNPEGTLACTWVQVFKVRKANENPERELKLTAENLFTTLLDPSAELSSENVRLVQFLALMLERKRVLKPKGLSADRTKSLYEHAKSKVVYEVPAGELTPEFFVQVQEQLSILVGEPRKAGGEAPAAPPSGA